MSHRPRCLAALACFVAGLTTPALYAQAVFGSLQGTVSDNTGAVLPKAKINIRNTATGVVVDSETNNSGVYFLGELRPGSYDLEIQSPGFQKYIQRGIALRVEDRLRVDVTLTLGQVTESVEVTAEAPLLQTENNTLGRVVEEVAIKQLPLRGRNAFELVLLTPGAQQRSDDEQPRLSGGRARTGEFLLDGGSITTPRRGQLFTQPNLDAVQEFKVQTSGLSAEFGRTVGGIVNTTLKSGTNDIRGDLFEFHRNNSINARNFFSSTTPKLIQNQFGAIIGGPIIKNRLFFFGDFESLRQRQESLFNLTVPTAQMKNGDFSQLLGAAVGTDAAGRTVLRNQIYDPSTTTTVNGRQLREPFPNNIIPPNRLDPAAKQLLSLYPAPNQPGLTQNFRTLIPIGIENNKFDVKIDWRASDRDMVFGRFSWDHQFSDTARPFEGSATGGNRGNFNRYLTSVLSWTHTFAPTVLNDARLSGFRGEQERLLSLNATAVPIPNLNIVGLPSITIPGYEGLGDSQAFDPLENTLGFQDVVTIVRGRHIMKAGIDLRSFPINDLQLQFTGTYGFASGQTADPSNAATSGSPLASLALGLANTFDNSTLRGRFYYRSKYLGAFFQDDLKVSKNLTVNLGLRYDVEQNPRELRFQGSNFDLKAGRVVTMRELDRDFIQFTDKLNFAPRVGFAWKPFGASKTVIRSHFGMFYIPLTGRATSAFGRYPADQRVGITSNGLTPAVIVSQTPAVVATSDGSGQALDQKNEHAPLGYFEQWNFDLQHELKGFLFQASYAGSEGHYLPMNQDWNVIPIEQVRSAGRGTQAMRPYPNFGNILAHDERGNSSYHALQLGLERRYAKGLYMSASYTWSKMIDYNEDDFSNMFPIDPYNLSLERGLSQSHFPHRFVTAAVYDLPFGRNRTFLHSGPASWIIGGWQISGILTLQSGQQVFINQPTNTSQMFSRSFRPNLVGDPVLPGSDRTLLRYFNTGAFQAPAPLTIGNSTKFPNIQGPGLVGNDVSMIRYFPVPLRDGMKFELRGDFFNVLNRTNFGVPNGDFGTANFGRITSAGTARVIQLGLKFWF